jgi:hypothetical protein
LSKAPLSLRDLKINEIRLRLSGTLGQQMRYLFSILFLIITINKRTYASPQVKLPHGFSKTILAELKPFFSPSEGQIKELLKGEVISTGKVESPTNKQQKLSLFVSGVHPRSCQRAMRKLSLYENYHHYMDFIKKSQYDDKTKKFTFVISHLLMPYDMVVSFKIPRITKEGVYPFTFENGFLKDLQGKVIVQKLGQHCLLGLKTDWQGPSSSIPDVIFSSFIQTVGRMGLEHLIRVSVF